MKKVKWILSSLLTLAVIVFVLESCSKSDDGPSTITLTGLTAGTMDLNGATSVTTVPTDAAFTATFSTDVDPATVSNSTITLTRDYDKAVVPLTVTPSGKDVTITPTVTLGTGSLYKINFSSDIKSKNGKLLTAIERNFTTAGSFAPTGAIAYWNFETNANDVIGNFDPAATGIVDISYVDGRNSLSGKAASFNGTTSIIEIPNGPDLVNTNDFTLSLWVKPDSSAHHGGNYVLGIGGFDGFEFEINKNDGKLAAQYNTGATTAGQDLWLDGTGNVGFGGWTFSKDLRPSGGFASIVQQKWSHFVFVYESATKIGTIYLNGEKVKTQDFNLYDVPLKNATGLKFNAATGVGTNLALGFYSDRSTTAFDWAHYTDTNANHYKGLMDDVYVYHTALSANLIAQMYNSGKP